MKSRIQKLRVLLVSSLIFLGAGFAFGQELKSDTALPRTLEELSRWYTEPATNGATYFLKAYEVLSNSLPLWYETNEQGRVVARINWSTATLFTNGPLSRATKASMAPYLRAIDMAWPLLKQGAECRQSRYPVNLAGGGNVLVPHLSAIHEDLVGCVVRSINEADARQGDAAVDSILLAFAVAQSLKAEPLFLSQEVRGHFQSETIDALEQLVNRASLPTGALVRLQNAINELEAEETRGEGFKRAWIGERLITASWVDLSSNKLYELGVEMTDLGIANFATNKIPEFIVQGRKTQAMDKRLVEETFDDVLSVWRAAYPKRFEVDEIFKTGMAEPAQRQFLLKGFVQAPLRIAQREGAIVVRLRLAQTAVALERYRAAHENRYPDSLSALAPEYLSAVPVDLFADAPLRYRRRGTGYVLYSVGKDRQDDGGLRKTDLVFETIKPPGRAIVE